MDAIEYYNKYASKIFEETVEEEVSEKFRDEFLSYLDEGDAILDLGCGSGRDSLDFYERGYDVTPLDGAEEMCRLAEVHTDLEVLCEKYEDMDFDDAFEGVWAREAFIHVPKDEIYEKEELEEILTDCGFKVLEIWEVRDDDVRRGYEGKGWIHVLAQKR